MQKDGKTTCHVILTPFNVRYFDSADVPGNDPKWLSHRFGLFERYSVPSVLSQTAQDFSWIILFDQDTPEPFASKARELVSLRRDTFAVFCRKASTDVIRSAVVSSLSCRPDWLLTTTFDNDDALHPQFVSELHKAFQCGTVEVLNFPNGIVLSGGRTYRRKDRSNAFISLSEPFEGFSTVLAFRQESAREFAPVRQLTPRPMWLQLVHRYNVSNRIRGWRISPRRVAEQFRLPIASNPGHSFWISAENIVLYLPRLVRDQLVTGVRLFLKSIGITYRRPWGMNPKPWRGVFNLTKRRGEAE